MKVLCVLALIACLHFGASKLQRAGLTKDKLQLRGEPVQHRALAEVVGELHQRHRRASGSPVNTSYTFSNDDHIYGLVHYSGSDSKVCVSGWLT